MLSGSGTGDRRTTRFVLFTVGVLLALSLIAGCSNDGDAQAGTTDPSGTESSAVESDAPAAPAECDQGPTVDEVEVAAVPDVPTDHIVTSFDGTEIRTHWFPAPDAADEPAPTVLMGPGWSLAGDTSTEGAAVFGALGIGALNEAGYNVLTWDPRGFGQSTGVATVNDPELEGRDVQVLIDWIAEQPTARTDRDGDPRVGMVGLSYGGGIQLTVAAIDCRVDAIVPGIAWSSLETSLYKSETVKTGWAGVLMDAAVTGNLDPHIPSAHTSGLETGTLSPEDRDWFLSRGPGELVEDVRIPTLLIGGTVDTLFTLDETITNHGILAGNDVPVAMLWFCGGHGACLTEEGDSTRIAARSMAWLDHHLRGDDDVDTGAGFELVDQNGRSWSAASFPPAEGEPITGSGSGTLALVEEGGATLSSPLTGGGVLDGLVSGITPGVATNAVEVRIEAPAEAGLALGAPELTLTYRGTVEPGARPTRVFAQLIDDERQVVVGNQITPIPLELDGSEYTIELPLEVIVQHLEPGQSLTLQLVATTSAYALPRLGGQVDFSAIEVSIPTATGMTQGIAPG